jgi:predicted enzyme related to lactoylglutathione lyase
MVCDMKLSFLYHPVKDLEKAVAFYRDVLGWDEAWREGEETAAMQIPDSEVTVMLDMTSEPEAASGFFGVDDVDAFYARMKDRLKFVAEPKDLPPIRYAAFTDPDGNVFRIYSEPEA